jgi:hypothetical protein
MKALNCLALVGVTVVLAGAEQSISSSAVGPKARERMHLGPQDHKTIHELARP